MRQFFENIIFFALVLLPFIAMPLLWRRMKRVRHQSYQMNIRSGEHPWQEPIEAVDGIELARSSSVNDDLIALGEKGRHSRWPLDNF